MRKYSRNFYETQVKIRNYMDKPGNEAGGCLHLVLSDENVYDEALEVCEELAIKERDEDGYVIIMKMKKLKMYEREEVVK